MAIDLIITGASRGIGRALALELSGESGPRLILAARDAERLSALKNEIEAKGGRAEIVVGDLASLTAARELGKRLVEVVGDGATLVHNAGAWPEKLVLTPDGFESSYVVNHLGPLAMQQPLLDAGRLRRIMVVSAGLIAMGRFNAAKTPVGDDFSRTRTYCTTKLCFAVAMRDVAAAHPELDVVALHPGVVRTDLGARPGLLGRLLLLLKRGFETPESCAARLARFLKRDRWSPPGEVRWFWEDKEKPWPAVASDERVRRAIREATRRALETDKPVKAEDPRTNIR